MAVQGCLSCVRYLVILINFIFWLAGIGVLAVSVWLYMDTSAYLVSEHSTKFFVSIFILMGVGGLMILVGFLGCCGASQESPCMLGTFSFLVFLILGAEIGVSVYAYTHQEEVKSAIIDGVQKMIVNEYGSQAGTTAAVDAMQKKFECCGAKGPDDWKEAKVNEGKTKFNYEIPQSCCRSDSKQCTVSMIPFVDGLFGDLHTQGCAEKVEGEIKSHLSIVLAVGVGLAVLQVLSFIFSLALCCAVNRPSSY